MCAFRAAGTPGLDAPPRRPQAWHGTDRQCRGHVLAILRAASGAVPVTEIEPTWPDPGQLVRAIAGLRRDGLIHGTDLLRL